MSRQVAAAPNGIGLSGNARVSDNAGASGNAVTLPTPDPVASVEPELAQLREVASRWTTRNGRNDTPWPGLVFARYEQPMPLAKGTLHSLSLAIVVSGRKVAHVSGRDYAYDASNYFVLTAATDIRARVVEASPSQPYLAMVLELPPALVAKTLTALADASPQEGISDDLPAYVAQVEPQLLEAACRFVRSIDDEAERRVLAPLALEEMTFRLLRSPHALALRRAAGAAQDSEQILRAMEYMREHAHRTLNVSRIAREVGMSASHFAHRFTQVARVSPMRYLKRIRLEEARQLLVVTACRASEVAHRVGYQTASHFTRDFKGYYGVPPAEFARSYRHR